MKKNPSLVGPLILITIGALALLANFGYLSSSFWITAIQFWPLILILIGLEILVGRQSWAGSIIVLLIGLGMVAGIVYLSVNPGAVSLGAGTVTDTISEPLGDVDAATVELKPGMGELKLSALDAGAPNLIDATITHPSSFRIDKDYQTDGARGQLKLDQQGTFVFMMTPIVRWQVALTGRVPLMLKLDAGVGSAEVDLNALNVPQLDVNAGVGTVTIIMPAHAGSVTANVDGGVGTVNILIPQDVPARIRTRSGIGGVSVNQARFPSIGDNLYESQDFASATNRIELDVNTGVGGISIP